MSRRNEYIVLLDKTKFAAPHEMKVFADEITMTQASDVVFSQIRDIRILDQQGQAKWVKDMAVVLVIPAGNFVRITQVNEHGAELYKESGAISMMQ